MTREEKSIAIKDLTAQLAGTTVLYVADISGLNADATSNLRRACYKAGIRLEVVKKLWKLLKIIMVNYRIL
jgi:large subunit ribosomal protein L10